MCLRQSVPILLVAGVAAAFSLTAAAQRARLALPLPAGHCALSTDHKADRAVLEMTRRMHGGMNRVLRVFAPCDKLERFRKLGGVLAERGVYLIPLSTRGRRITMPRRQFLESVAHVSQTMAYGEVEKDVRSRVRKSGAGVRSASATPVGLIHSDDDGVYFGAVRNVTRRGAPQMALATVTGLTLLRGRVVGLNLSQLNEDDGTIKNLLAAQRSNIRRLIRANRRRGRR